MRRFHFSNVLNMRNLGGYPTASGGATCYNRLIRSDAPIALSANEIEVLRSRGITTVIDLRGQGESAKQPSALAQADGFDCRNIPLGNCNAPETEDEMAPGYLRMTEQTDAMAQIMRVISRANGGVLFHCASGKDRTGVVAALLLSLAEVPLADILADYQISYIYVRKEVLEYHASHPDAAPWVGQSKTDYMERFLSLFAERYSSVTEYLLSIGLSESEIERVEDKLISC